MHCDKKRYIRYFLQAFGCLGIVLNYSPAFADDSFVGHSKVFVVSHAASMDASVPRLNYEINVLKLALEHTRKSHGDFKINTYPYSSRARITRELAENRWPNATHIFGYSTKKDYLQSLAYVKFPAFLGVLGYRVCFVSDEAKKKFSRVKTVSDLRKFKHGQGQGWTDSFVLQHNGIEVVEFDRVPRLIRMTAENNVHVFCRGINEIKDEYEENKSLNGLSVDSSVALYYPHPRFFYTHKNNKELIERLELGLMRAFEDGSLHALFLKSYEENLAYVDMSSRTIVSLQNPFLEGLDFDYSPFVMNFKKQGDRVLGD